MGRFDGRKVDGKLYFALTPDPSRPPSFPPNTRGEDKRGERHASFGGEKEVTLPVFSEIQNRGGIVLSGIAIEIDLIGLWTFTLPLPEEMATLSLEIEEDEARRVRFLRNDALPSEETGELIIPQPPENPPQSGAWLVQVRYTKDPMSSTEIRKFLKQVEAMTASIQYDFVQSWYVCKGGFTKPARKLLEKAGVLYNDRESFNKLANLFGFFGLPA